MLKYIIALILFCAIPGYAQEWSKADIAAEAVVATTLGLDWLQTRDIKNHPNTYEQNPILGKHPSDDKIDAYFASCIIGHAVVAHYLPDVWKALGSTEQEADTARKVWQYIWIWVNIANVRNNHANLGLRIHF